MKEESRTIRQDRTLKDWVVATRPWSFPASFIPVLVVSAWLYWLSQEQYTLQLDWWCAPIALVMIVLLQASGNLIGDYSDHMKGIDLPGSLNGVRHIQSGKFLPHEILCFGYTLLAVSLFLGVIILWRCGWEAAWLGIAAVFLVTAYPWLKAHALGDLDILLGYALLPALGVGFVVGGRWMWQPSVISLSIGLLTVAILHANNTRDILNDTRAGIVTLCIILGGRASQWIYVIENVLAYLLIPAFILLGLLPWPTLVTWLTLPLACNNIRTMLQGEPLAEKPIAMLDQRTAQAQMAFGLLLTLSLLVVVWTD
ncbi:MAG: prenyltransferase [Bacteroidaceae bacterium]